MKRSAKSHLRKHRPTTDPTGLAVAERVELQRQGAKAAARGGESSENPMDEPRNMPATTGESAALWSERKDAWQSGHEAQTKVDEEASSRGKSHRTEDEH
ncbi:hypothetical protein SAMN05216359_10619 [Roseateles sp. YR242]|uniref:CrpP-related protein n=1 Tax=Roseateles sp. YR242 TaxID=1855305 RepID=UPI0008C9F94E|nr:CrpP-related protein [Roseateles sp. YR242]SEL17194.1 hypothetical protein SAMN05216359_10619 [Roseateles sp. YR242]